MKKGVNLGLKMVEIDPGARRGKAARIGELWRWEGGETEKLLRRGPAAATESLKVLTCIWAGCQPEQTGVPLQSRAVQLESFRRVPFQSDDRNARS